MEGAPGTRLVRRPPPGEWVLFAYLAVVTGLTIAAEGWLGLQIAATAVLGVAAIRLAGGGVFWSAAIITHVAGTLLVYVGVWIADAMTPPGTARPSGLEAQVPTWRRISDGSREATGSCAPQSSREA